MSIMRWNLAVVIFGSLFLLKLLSNAMIPVTLARLPRGPMGEEPGVSSMTFVEVGLLMILVALSALGLAPYGVLATFVVGSTSIVGSCALLMIIAVVMGELGLMPRRDDSSPRRK